MFEDDVPSVLELEMEDLEQWMNKDGESSKKKRKKMYSSPLIIVFENNV